MGLFDILKDRGSVNILKQLYNQEVVLKTGYTMKISDIQRKIQFQNMTDSADILAKNGLISLEIVEKEHIVSITEKGKHFIEVFDQLVDLFNVSKISGKPEGKSVKIKYNLVEIEKKIMVMVYKITKETGRGVDLKTLTSEIYPYHDYKTRVGTVSRYVNKLSDLKLIDKAKDGRSSTMKLTNTGFKVMNEQFLKVLV